MSFVAYLLRCADGSYYVGHTDDLATRVAQHQSGQIEGYTADRLPVEPVWSEQFPDRDQAFQVERQLKGWSRAKKEALIRGDFDGLQLLSRKLFMNQPNPLILSSREDGVSKDPPHTNPLIPSSREDAVSKDPPHTDPLIPSSREDGVSKDPPHTDPLIPSSGEDGGSKDPPHTDPLILSSGSSRVSKDPPCFDTEPTAPTQHEREEGSKEPQPPIIILVRPQLGENIGKAARAMLNFGLTELRLVAPRDGWPNPSAGPAASGADLVLAQARVYATTAEAIADCSTVFAATVRRRELMTPVVGPEEMAAGIHRSAGRSAILFGPERSGLETEDVALANAIVTIPINPQFGSINLAQAVILLAYEWSKSQELAQPTVRELEPVAPHAELDGFLAQLEEALEGAGYFKPPERIQVTKNTLRTIFTKTRWTTREIRAVRGVIRILAHPRVQPRP